MAKQTLTLSNDQILMINNYLLSEEYWQNKNDSIDGKLSWSIRKNRKEIANAIELIKEAETEINNEYNTDEKSEFEVDENGNKTDNKIVKAEFKEEFINKKMELYQQTQELNIIMVDSSEFFKYNMKDTDWEMMSFMINEDDDAEEDYNKQESEKAEEPAPASAPVD